MNQVAFIYTTSEARSKNGHATIEGNYQIKLYIKLFFSDKKHQVTLIELFNQMVHNVSVFPHSWNNR